MPLVAGVFVSQFTQPTPRLNWTVYVAMSVTPPSGAHVTMNVKVFVQGGRLFTWDVGRVVSTTVHVSLAFPGPGSTFPARSSAIVWNSYVPSPVLVKLMMPKEPAGTFAESVQPPTPFLR